MTIIRIGVQMLELVKRSSVVLVFLTLALVGSQAQTFNLLATFDNTGEYPDYSGLIQGINGNFYGTTSEGLTNSGTLFDVSPSGSLNNFYSFCLTSCTDIGSPLAGVMLGTDGNFYGTTYGGNGCGSVFRISQRGKETTLHTFHCSDGGNLVAGVIQGTDGYLYGTTSNFGVNCKDTCGGTVFRISPAGVMNTIHNFCSLAKCADGSIPYAGLVQASDGNLYGTTTVGGTFGQGTIFRVTRTGTLTTLYNFCSQTGCPDGAQPFAGLVQGKDGNLYGTTQSGGNGSNGTIFQTTLTGVLTTLYRFCSSGPPCLDGSAPYATLMQATDGNFYGSTTYGGSTCVPGPGCGTVFMLTPSGTLTTIHSFCAQSGCTDGLNPQGALLQATNGTIYGLTPVGGTGCQYIGCGTVFSLDMGFGPFVTFVMKTGKVGGTAEILGQGFTGTTAVSFNGVPASFTVHSDTLLLAKVPSGATTGLVTVTTPSGTLTSNVAFQVIP